MKLRLKGKIESMTRLGHWVEISVSFDGSVIETKLFDAKDVDLTGKIRMKPLMADQLKLGSVLHMDISVDEDD